MKKIYLATALLSSVFINLGAQNFDWAKREGKYAYDYGYGVSTDNSGNVYVAGKYEEDGAMFSGTTVPCAGNHDMYLVKYTSSGSLLWIRTAGGVLGDYAHAMTCDGTSAVYVAGEIEGAGDVISFPGSTTTLTAVGDNDVFVAKYDLSGTLLWARSEGTYKSEKALGVTNDAAGNVYICGYFTDTAMFGGTSMPGGGYHDMFIAKYNSSGTLQWAKTAGGPGREEALSIKCNAAGEVYVCGMYSDGANFGGTVLTTPVTPTGHYLNAFVAKYAADGSMLWVKSAGGDYDDVAWSLTIDNTGKVYIAGEFNAYALFDTHALTTSGNADAFVAAYDPAGNVTWATGAGGVLSDRARGIGTDGTNLFITGQFGSTGVFGTTTQTAVDSSDIFIAGLNNSGSFLWSKAVSGTADAYEGLGYESGNAVCADGPNNIYVTGALLNGGTFGVYSFTDYSRTDMFVAKLNMLVGVEEVQGPNSLNVYPNPATGNFTIDLSDIKDEKTEVTIYNYLGAIVEMTTNKASSSLNVDISTQEKGIYFVEIKTPQKVYREKVVLQ
ncbi:MAG: hypothetical protein JWO44_2808 [Bacteroidetes bacterium]|nr:hypothetical protein [Bacteroidota bacterium]